MTVIDTSVLIAIAAKDAEAAELTKTIEAEEVVVGAPTLVETFMVLKGSDRIDPAWALAPFLDAKSVSVVSFTKKHYEAAADAFDSFGRGRHPAKLNFGDCMSYAVAKVRSEALLFKGRDFNHTDLELHPASVIVTPD